MFTNNQFQQRKSHKQNDRETGPLNQYAQHQGEREIAEYLEEIGDHKFNIGQHKLECRRRRVNEAGNKTDQGYQQRARTGKDHVGQHLAHQKFSSTHSVNDVLTDGAVLKFVGDGNNYEYSDDDFKKAADVIQVEPHVREMIQRASADVDVSSDTADGPGQPLEKLHAAGCHHSKRDEVATAHNPKGTVVQTLFQVDTQEVEQFVQAFARISRNCFSRLFFFEAS